MNAWNLFCYVSFISQELILRVMTGLFFKRVSCFLDAIPTKLLTNHLLPIITEILNSSLASWVFPFTLKAALVKQKRCLQFLATQEFPTCVQSFIPIQNYQEKCGIENGLQDLYAVSKQTWTQYRDCFTSCPKWHSFSSWSEVCCVIGSYRFKDIRWHDRSPNPSYLPQRHHCSLGFSTKLVWLLPYWPHPMCNQ